MRIIAIVAFLATLTLYQNCGQLKSANVTGLDLLSENENISLGKSLYQQHCAVCHSNIETSGKRNRTIEQIQNAISQIPQMNHLSFLTAAEIETISAALSETSVETEVGENGRLVFACSPETKAPTPILKLVNRELQNSINQILDQFSATLKNDSELNSLYSSLPQDNLPASKDTYKEQSQLVTQLSTVASFNVVYRAAELISENQNGLNQFDNCLSQNNLSSTCHRSFVEKLTELAFRRPLTTNELNALSAELWDSSINKTHQLILSFTSILQMPEFQYKVFNHGTPTDATNTAFHLTNHEIAAKLSYLLTGKAPDSRLRSLADQGRLSDNSVLSSEIDRLFLSTDSQDTIVRLFRESYGYEVFPTFSYSNAFLNGVNTTNLVEAMTQELDSFFVNTVLFQDGNFQDLMTSRQTNISHSGLNSIYGTNLNGSGTLPVERSGFLSRAAMLTKRSGYRASPIKRGLHIYENVLCQEIGAPPQDAPTSLPPVDGLVTTRENAERASEAPGSSCVFCHSRFNSLGYAYESFDSLGRTRSLEDVYESDGRIVASLPVDTNAQTDELGPTRQSFSGPPDFSYQLGQSDRALLCFAQKIKNFESRVHVTSANNCQMNDILSVLYGTAENGQGSIKEAIKALVLSTEFKLWQN